MGRKVLIVDDEKVMNEVMEKFMEMIGLETDSVTDGMAAWQKIHQSPENYCIIITDLHMEGLNGLDLIRRIKENFLMPIILLTGDITVEETETTAIPDAVMRKPCSMQDIQKQTMILINQYHNFPIIAQSQA